MSDMDFHHVSVLLEESIDGLEIKPDGIYIDGTAGGAGHSREIAKRLTTGRLIALDKDPDAVEIAAERLRILRRCRGRSRGRGCGRSRGCGRAARLRGLHRRRQGKQHGKKEKKETHDKLLPEGWEETEEK